MPWSLFPTKKPTLSRSSLDLLVLFGLLLIFYGQPLLNPTKISYGDDFLSLFLPAMEHYRLALFHGVVPLWNSNVWMGAPFLASFQPAVLYPPQLLSLFFSDAASALNFQLFLSILWFAYGAYFFGLRALRLERAPSMLMAITLGCSGFIGAHLDHVSQIAAISWIPWILTEALLLLFQPRLREMNLLALCLGMQVLAGHPQYTIYTIVYLVGLTACYIVYLIHRRSEQDLRAWAGTGLIVVGVLLGLGLGAAQVLPALELGQLSLRALDVAGSERMFLHSFPPTHLITLVHPYAFGTPLSGLHDLSGNPLAAEDLFAYQELVCYMGLATLALAALAVASLFQEFVVRCFLLLALCILPMAFGDHVTGGLIYRLANFWIPGTEHLRVPARMMIFFNFSLAVLAAMGFNQVIHYLRERRRARTSTLGPLRFLILVIILGDLYLFSRSQVFRLNDSVDVIRNPGPVEQYLEGQPDQYRVFRQMRELRFFLHLETLGGPGSETLKRRRNTAAQQYIRLQPNLNLLTGTQLPRGYEEGLLPTISLTNFLGSNEYRGFYHRNLMSPRPDTLLLGLMNVRYILADKPQLGQRLRPLAAWRLQADPQEGFFRHLPVPLEALERAEWWQSSEEADRLVLYENLDALPRFVPAEPLRRVLDLEALDWGTQDREELLTELDPSRPRYQYRLGGELRFDWRADLRAAALDLGRPKDSPNAYSLTKPSELEGEFLMLEAAYPGWVCRYDGRRVPLERVNPVMMSVQLPAEATRLEFRFEPYSYRLGLYLSGLSLALLCFLVPFSRYPRSISLKHKDSET